MPLDIPWLVHREKERERAANAGIPLDTLRAPPTYTTTTQTGVESIHNHYYTQPAYVPWYKKKWFFYAVIVALLFTVLAAAIILGVVLKHEANKRAGGTADGAVASAGATETTQAPSTSAAESTERLQPWETMSPRPSSSVTKAQPTATPFTLSERSQLASIYVKVGNQDLDRRLLVRQEDTDDLLVTEWSGGGVAHYRLKDKLGPLMVTAKGGTPLALQADNTGTVHLFYLGTTNILLHVFETGAGKWKEDELQSDHGRIRTSKYSTLSTAWHQGRQSPGLLVVAYDNPSDIMQLAMSDSPTESSPWYLADVTSVSVDSVPGQSNIPSYSLGGDWYDRDSKDKDGFQNLLIVIVNGREIVPWECSVDYWPPPDVEVKCHEAKDSFKGMCQGYRRGVTVKPDVAC